MKLVIDKVTYPMDEMTEDSLIFHQIFLHFWPKVLERCKKTKMVLLDLGGTRDRSVTFKVIQNGEELIYMVAKELFFLEFNKRKR